MRKLLVALAAGALLLAACGGGPAPGEAVAHAAEAAKEQGTVKVHVKATNSLTQGDFTVEGDGELDFDKQLGHITMQTSGSAVETAGVAMSDIEAIYADLVIYMRMGAFEGLLPEGKHWIKIDLQAVGEGFGFDFAQLAQLGQSDPSQQLDFLTSVSDVEDVGSEEVRGVDTTHYEGVLDYDRVAKEFPETADSIRQVQKLTGVTKTPIDIWIDAEGLPRRLSYEMKVDPPANSPAAGMTGTSTFTLEYYDYGTDVSVAIPPKSEVLDPSKLQG